MTLAFLMLGTLSLLNKPLDDQLLHTGPWFLYEPKYEPRRFVEGLGRGIAISNLQVQFLTTWLARVIGRVDIATPIVGLFIRQDCPKKGGDSPQCHSFQKFKTQTSSAC